AAIANGGTLYRPQLVREQGILDQRTFMAEPEINGTFDVRPDVVAEVQSGLCQVTTEQYGTASHIFRLPSPSPLLNIGVCAKTGTAESQVDIPHSWFAAYAPRDNPQIATIVMIETSGDGSAIAAPLTERIMEYFFFGPFD
ncbi:MAG: penicillin-binding transpeptidase domain-containing protein, partial [Aggregatilineales bacterium]